MTARGGHSDTPSILPQLCREVASRGLAQAPFFTPEHRPCQLYSGGKAMLI